jgi:hypothetical protein
MRISFTLSRIAGAVTLGLTVAGCIAHRECAYTDCSAGSDCITMAGGAETAFACPGYGPANRCLPTPATASNPSCRRATNMQPGATNLQPSHVVSPSHNPVMPYSTDDNNPNLPYAPGGVRTAPGRVDGFAPN